MPLLHTHFKLCLYYTRISNYAFITQGFRIMPLLHTAFNDSGQECLQKHYMKRRNNWLSAVSPFSNNVFYCIKDNSSYVHFVVCISMGKYNTIVSATYNSIALTHRYVFKLIEYEFRTYRKGLTRTGEGK